MRDEWLKPVIDRPMVDEGSPSEFPSQGLTRQPQRAASSKKPSMQNISLAMASRAMKLKRVATREVSERRQVGDAEEMVNGPQDSTASPWWRHVSMEEGM
jgi:pyruvate dehydrogenase kinase 2/3/4